MILRHFFSGKLRYVSIFVLFVIAVFIIISSFATEGAEKDKKRLLLGLITTILKRGHYHKMVINDSFSEKVYQGFIEKMDSGKRYLTKKDLEVAHFYKDKIDDQIKVGNTRFFDVVKAYYKSGVQSAYLFSKEYLQSPIDFTVKDSIRSVWDDFAKDSVARDKRWAKILKSRVLDDIKRLEKREKNKVASDSLYQVKSFKALEIQARRDILENFEERQKVYRKKTDMDYFSVYLNTIATTFDPHTNYMSPSDKNRFDTNISGKLEGIGAVLQEKGDYIKVVSLVVGGPSWKQGDLEANDLITAVQQEGEKSVDIAGMSINSVIELIKGRKGTKVTLTVEKIDKSIQKIKITRDVIELEDSFLKAAIIKKGAKKYGYIYLPQFYIDFKERHARNAASDMEKALANFQKEQVAGVLLDLRSNGGGSLSTAIDIGGFFVDSGPIVQVRQNDQIIVHEDKNPRVQWDKPLVIMVNYGSASASEILAAAMQDYGRAVVIGTQTFGKGTVQNLLSLNRYVNYDEALGALKLTIQKFYRVNGGSTQIKGVTPDVFWPDNQRYSKGREGDLGHVLPWDSIPNADYQPQLGYTNFKEAVAESQKRIDGNKRFQKINDYVEEVMKDIDTPVYYSLNYDLSKQKDDSLDQIFERYKDTVSYQSPLRFQATLSDSLLFKTDTIEREKKEQWIKDLKKDMFINEGVELLSKLKMTPKR